MKFITFAVQVVLVSAIIVISPIATSAITVREVPGSRPHSWVTDSIDILSPKTEAEINRLVNQLEAKNSCEVMVVTVPETKGYSSPREFALAWFNYWTIGKKGLDNGVLLMYSRGDDRLGQTPHDRIEIVTGWGIRPMLSDAQVVSLIQRDIRPRVNQRNYNGAMLTGTQEVVKVLQNYQPKATSPSSSRPAGLLNKITEGIDTLFGFIFGVLFFGIIASILLMSIFMCFWFTFALFFALVSILCGTNESSGSSSGKGSTSVDFLSVIPSDSEGSSGSSSGTGGTSGYSGGGYNGGGSYGGGSTGGGGSCGGGGGSGGGGGGG